MTEDQNRVNLSLITRRGYLHVGPPEEFLSVKIRDLFGLITTDRGVADHNSMAEDIKMMVREADHGEFFRQISLVIISFAGKGVQGGQTQEEG